MTRLLDMLAGFYIEVGGFECYSMFSMCEKYADIFSLTNYK